MTVLQHITKLIRIIFSNYYASSARFAVVILTIVTVAQHHTVLRIMSVWSHNLSSNIVTVVK